jgi:hypothetical protein
MTPEHIALVQRTFAFPIRSISTASKTEKIAAPVSFRR